MLAGLIVDSSENWIRGLLAKSWEKEMARFDESVMVAIHESEI